MKDIAIVMPVFKCPELLNISIESILRSHTTNSELIVTVNEMDDETLKILNYNNVKFIESKKNIGPSAVDLAIPYIKEKQFKYVCNINSDMLVFPGWENIIINTFNENKLPCSVSAMLIEKNSTAAPPIVIVDDLGDFNKENIVNVFFEKIKNNFYKKYNLGEDMRTYGHHITVKTSDFLKVNGYSDSFDEEFIELCGSGLDDFFAFRLNKLYNEKFLFIRNNNLFTYHLGSYNRKKFDFMNKKTNNLKNGDEIFTKKTKINRQQNYKNCKCNC